MDEALKITTADSREQTVVVRAAGRLDAKTAPRLLEHCQSARPPGGRIVLNLEAIQFLSSSGVGVLLVLAERCRDDGGSLRITASASVRAPLELLNLHRFLQIDGSEDEALGALGT